MKEEWKDKLQSSMADYKESAPEDLWNDISKVLSANEKNIIGKQEKPKKNSKLIVISTIAAAACITGMIGIFFNTNKTENEKKVLTAEKQTRNIVKNKDTEKGNAESKIIAYAQSTKEYPEKTTVEKLSTLSEKLSTLSDESNNSVENLGDKENNIDKCSNRAEKKEQKPTAIKRNYSYSKNFTQYSSQNNTYKAESKKENRSKITASMFAANTMTNGGTQTATVMPVANDALFFCIPDNKNDANRNTHYLVGKNENDKVKHHQPIRFGFSVRYSLTSKIGIETGVTYSYLSSDIKQGTDDNYNITQQKLHFIGIPINLDYSLWRNKWLNVYASIGGMAEKNIKGKTSTEYRLNGKVLSEDNENIKMKELQWSTNIAAGIQLNAIKGIGVYVEPGVGYYIDNGSNIKTAYSEKPLCFNLKFGIRYSFE